MAYPPNEGGNGGKFRRRPSARTPSKPYDRPPTALRGVRGGGLVTGERGGWMSKILDPASRLFANGTANFFASLFRKRLTAPPLEQGEDLHSGADSAGVSQDTSTIPLSETRNGKIHNGGSSIDNQNNNSDCGIVELEQLLKQRTFTMGEFNRLEGLILSRTVESSKANHENSVDKKGKSVVLASDDVPGSSKLEKSCLVPSNDLASQNPMSEASSPAEVAKAYMSLKPSKDSSLSGSLQDQISNEVTNLKSMASAPRRLDLSVAPRSVIRFSGIPEQPQSQNHAYQTSKPVGRFAMYRMSRSPYFKVNRTASSQVGEISRDDHSSPVSSQWTPNSVKSCGKQALKRGITALDEEYESLGSIRRIRQKSNLTSPSRIYNSSSLTQKSLYLEAKKHDSTSSESAEDGMENSIMLPVQSNEKTHKLLQQLDKHIPLSPKEKPSKLKAMVIDGPPSKLTVDMLHGSALKSMEAIKSFNIWGTEEATKAATPSMREKMDEESSLPQNPPHSGMNSKAPQANGVSNTTIPSKNITKPVPITEKSSASSSVSLSISEKPAFWISAPEDSFDLDEDEDGNTNDLSIPSTSSPSDSITEISVRNDSSSKTSPEKLFSSSMLSRNDAKKAAMLSVLTGKDNGFAFPIASDTSTQSQPPPTPTMPISKLNSQKETAPKPVASSESKNLKFYTFSTNIGSSSSDNAGIKVGEEIRSEAIQTTSSSTTANSANESNLVRSEVGKMGDVLISPTNTILKNSCLSSAAATFSTTAPSSLFQQPDIPKSNDVEANTFKASSFSAPLFSDKSGTSSSPAFPGTPIFGISASTQSIGSAAPFQFGSSFGSATSPFTFGSSSTSATASFAFNSSSTNKDEMSVEDSMIDASNEAPSFPALTSPGFVFGSPAPPHQNGAPSFSFQASGSFSLGSGAAADKSARKIIKVKRGIRARK